MHRVVIQLHYKNCGRHKGHLISLLAKAWLRDGINVEFHAGTDPAEGDLLFHHIATSRVSRDYLSTSDSFKNSINQEAHDIRKHIWMEDLLSADSSYEGPVIVKTTLNYAGLDEVNLGLNPYIESGAHSPLVLGRAGRFLPKRWKNYLSRIGGVSYFTSRQKPYRVYPSLKHVPRQVFSSKILVVQPYLAEMHQGKYCLREWYFLGDSSFDRAELGDEAILTSGTYTSELVRSPPPEALALREKLKLDYGKIDYAIVNGKTVIYDANKTMGLASPTSPNTLRLADELAKGIYKWL